MSETTAGYNTKKVFSTDSTATDKIRNEFAAYGLEILKRSVLLVLYDADQPLPRRVKKLKMDEIRKHLGIPQITREIQVGSSNDLLCGVLQHLLMEGLVNHTVHIGWEITIEGVEFIEG